ncbi:MULTISPECIES: recombinase family protein [unclassified Paenibacillus]|uniref:recombinase family protein n=1 Tax=unclassified Paenibacillus TaxID=185978 RepID=UPI003636E8A3
MRVCIYTRVSTTTQVEEGFSLQAQYDRLVEHTKNQGWELIRIYTDPGISAKNLNRPGVKELIQDLMAKKFDAVLVHKLDRLTRNISDLHKLVELVNKMDIKLISLSENIDTSSAMGRAMIYFLGLFAQMFRENLSEEVKKGLSERADLGLRNAFAPYGYEMNEAGELVIVQEKAEVIREVFRVLLEKKWGYVTIAKHLNLNNKIGIRGGSFHGSTVERILKNHTYTGKNHWKAKNLPESKRIIRNATHAAIIDEETFNKAQTIIQRRSRKEMSRSSYNYPFSTIIRCGKCGGPYHGHTMPKSGSTYYYYRCTNKLRGKCDQSDLSEHKFEKMFFEHFVFQNQGLEFQEVAATKNELEVERKKLEKKLLDSERRRKTWHHALGDGKMPYEDYVKLIDEELMRVEELKNELKLLPEDKPIKITAEEVVETIANLSENWSYLERETRKDFINTLFKGISITKTERKWAITKVEWA